MMWQCGECGAANDAVERDCIVCGEPKGASSRPIGAGGGAGGSSGVRKVEGKMPPRTGRKPRPAPPAPPPSPSPSPGAPIIKPPDGPKRIPIPLLILGLILLVMIVGGLLNNRRGAGDYVPPSTDYNASATANMAPVDNGVSVSNEVAPDANAMEDLNASMTETNAAMGAGNVTANAAAPAVAGWPIHFVSTCPYRMELYVRWWSPENGQYLITVDTGIPANDDRHLMREPSRQIMTDSPVIHFWARVPDREIYWGSTTAWPGQNFAFEGRNYPMRRYEMTVGDREYRFRLDCDRALADGL